jgi:hypothetical protein
MTLAKRCYQCQQRKPSAKLADIFCSQKCAAEYGVQVALNSHENDINWCDLHGWFVGYLTYDGCPKCKLEPTE